MNSKSKSILAAATLGAILAIATGCAGHGIPGHGGGMRFYWEQETLDLATEECLKNIGLGQLSGKSVRLVVHSVGYEGGGTSSKAPGLIDFGVMGNLVGRAAPGGSAMATSAADSGAGEYQPYAIANARDIEYLKGALIFKLAEAGVTICDAGNSQACAGTLHVLVPVFGTDKWSHGFMVMRQERLTAKVKVAMVFVDAAGKISKLGGNEAAATYGESFFFGVQWDDPSVHKGSK